MNKKHYSTEDVENILREIAAQDKRAAMSDAFTEKMLRLIDDEVERSMRLRLYKLVAQVAASIAALAVVGVVLMQPTENTTHAPLAEATELKKTVQILAPQIDLNELDALKNGMLVTPDEPHAVDDASSVFGDRFRITVCVDTL